MKVELDSYGMYALKDIDKNGSYEIADKDTKKDIMRDHPALRRQACETAVEEGDGYFDENDCDPENELCDSGKLHSKR